jgi:hypothetical protein
MYGLEVERMLLLLLLLYLSVEFVSYVLDSCYSVYSGPDSEDDDMVYDYDDFKLF